MLKLRYDGTSYCGWQKQANGETVQGVLEQRLGELCGEKISVTGCSRTDAGVHAIEYVCNFRTESTFEPLTIKRALNAMLPKDIAVLDAEYAEDEFNSRFDVAGKTYIYQILNSVEHDPFLNGYAYHIKALLDVSAMNEAAEYFVGEFDFSAFTTAESQVKNTTRVITDCKVEKAGELVTITVAGLSFLHNMVRIIAGTIIKVGLGKLSPDDIPKIIQSGKRENAGATALAKGLFLKEVFLSGKR